MTPIGILTRNRAKFLDVTLRSLSATLLPEDQVLQVFDDHSDDLLTRGYLYGTLDHDLRREWPNNAAWRMAGLHRVTSQVSPGLGGKIVVGTLGAQPRGVMAAGCAALRYLTHRCPNQPVVLLQDDVIFRQDWLQRLEVAAKTAARSKLPPPGLVVGCDINRECHGGTPCFLVRQGGLTAQCYYFTAVGAAGIQDWLHHPPQETKGFDNKVCAAVRSAGLGVYLMMPGVCQHFGVESLVRPNWGWNKGGGRVDLDAQGPYVVGPSVRRFRPL